MPGILVDVWDKGLGKRAGPVQEGSSRREPNMWSAKSTSCSDGRQDGRSGKALGKRRPSHWVRLANWRTTGGWHFRQNKVRAWGHAINSLLRTVDVHYSWSWQRVEEGTEEAGPNQGRYIYYAKTFELHLLVRNY